MSQIGGCSLLEQLILAWSPGLIIFALLAGGVKLSARLFGPWQVSWKNAFLFALLAMVALIIGKSIPKPTHFIYQFTVCVMLGAFFLGKRSKDKFKNEIGLNRGAQLGAAGFVLWTVTSDLFIYWLIKAVGL